MRFPAFAAAAVVLGACATGANRVDEACAAHFGRDLRAFADCAEREGARGGLARNEWRHEAEVARLYGQGARVAQMAVAEGRITEGRAWSDMVTFRARLAAAQAGGDAATRQGLAAMGATGAAILHANQPRALVPPAPLPVRCATDWRGVTACF